MIVLILGYALGKGLYNQLKEKGVLKFMDEIRKNSLKQDRYTTNS